MLIPITYPSREKFELSVLFKDSIDDPDETSNIVGVCGCGKREFILYPLALLMAKVGLDYKCSECRGDLIELITGGSINGHVTSI